MSEQAELADGDGYLQGKAGLHRLVEAHCGLSLINVKIKYGKNTPYDPDPAMEPETTEYDHGIFVTADFAHQPGPHARFTEWLLTAHTVERRAGTKSHNWYLESDTTVKESDHVRRVPGEGSCFHHELVGQVRDKLERDPELPQPNLEVIPRDLSVEDDDATLKVETWTSGSQNFYVAHFRRSSGTWNVVSTGPDPDQPCC